MAWLARLPHAIAQLEERWQLSIGERFDGEGDASWVAPAVRRDGSPGVLKLGMPHMEAEHEADGLRFWNGDPTVRLLEADDSLGAMLLERCDLEHRSANCRNSSRTSSWGNCRNDCGKRRRPVIPSVRSLR